MEEIKTVKDIALYIIRINDKYSGDLLQLLPEELLQRKVSKPINGNVILEIVRTINEIRFEKEDLLMLPISAEGAKNIDIGTRFLFSVAAFISH